MFSIQQRILRTNCIKKHTHTNSQKKKKKKKKKRNKDKVFVILGNITVYDLQCRFAYFIYQYNRYGSLIHLYAWQFIVCKKAETNKKINTE